MARLRGTVYGLDGKRLRRVFLRLTTHRVGVGGRIDVPLMTDDEGRFVHEQGLPAGNNMLYLGSRIGQGPTTIISRILDVDMGDDLDLRLDPRGDCTLEGSCGRSLATRRGAPG